MGFFDFLNGISPWWWVAFGVALGAVEMATMSFFLIWPALAAILVAVLLLASPSMGGEAQIVLFSALAVALTFTGRWAMHRFGDRGEAARGLNSRAELMIGRHGEVLEFHGPEGAIRIDGIRWKALWPERETATPGDKVLVVSADGMTLVVKNAG